MKLRLSRLESASSADQGGGKRREGIAAKTVFVNLRRAAVPTPPILEVHVGERLPAGVAHDEAGLGLLDGPRRWEAAGRATGMTPYARGNGRCAFYLPIWEDVRAQFV
jgi:hypothetical protein